MIADQQENRNIAPYADERIREKMIDGNYEPFVENDALYFLEREEGIDRICRLPLISYETMHLPHQTLRSTTAHVEFLNHLVAICSRLKDVARILGVRPDKAHTLLERYEIDLYKYRMRKSSDPVPPGLDFEAFRHDFEIEAFSSRELEEKYELSTYRVHKIVDRKDLVEPTDQVKMIKRYERNPDYRNVRSRGIPRPPSGRIKNAIASGHDTLERLASHFGTSITTVRDWLDATGIQTPRMVAYEKSLDEETSLHDLVYDEVFKKRRPLEQVAKETKYSYSTIWRVASGFPEWESVKNLHRKKHVETPELRRVYHAVKEKRMTKKKACAVLKVSHNTLTSLFESIAPKKGQNPYDTHR